MLKTLHPYTRQLIDYKEYKEFAIKNGDLSTLYRT